MAGVEYRQPMKFPVSIYQDEDGIYIAECPAIPGCVSQGASQAEAEANTAESKQTGKTPSARVWRHGRSSACRSRSPRRKLESWCRCLPARSYLKRPAG